MQLSPLMVLGLPHAAIVSASIYSRKRFVLDAKEKYAGLKLAAVGHLFVRHANHWNIKQNKNQLLKNSQSKISWFHNIPAIDKFLIIRWGVDPNIYSAALQRFGLFLRQYSCAEDHVRLELNKHPMPSPRGQNGLVSKLTSSPLALSFPLSWRFTTQRNKGQD